MAKRTTVNHDGLRHGERAAVRPKRPGTHSSLWIVFCSLALAVVCMLLVMLVKDKFDKTPPGTTISTVSNTLLGEEEADDITSNLSWLVWFVVGIVLSVLTYVTYKGRQISRNKIKQTLDTKTQGENKYHNEVIRMENSMIEMYNNLVELSNKKTLSEIDKYDLLREINEYRLLIWNKLDTIRFENEASEKNKFIYYDFLNISDDIIQKSRQLNSSIKATESDIEEVKNKLDEYSNKVLSMFHTQITRGDDITERKEKHLFDIVFDYNVMILDIYEQYFQLLKNKDQIPKVIKDNTQTFKSWYKNFENKVDPAKYDKIKKKIKEQKIIT